MTARLLGTARSEGSLLGTSQPPRKMSAVVKAFRAKLIQVNTNEERSRYLFTQESDVFSSLLKSFRFERSTLCSSSFCDRGGHPLPRDSTQPIDTNLQQHMWMLTVCPGDDARQKGSPVV